MYMLPLPFLLGTLATLGSIALLGGRHLDRLGLDRRHPELLRGKINGMVFMDTTHTWPLNTVMASGLLKLLRCR